MTVEATLKKAGFDVIGLSNEYSISEQMLAFNPDLVVGSGRGGRVNSLGVGKRLKEMGRWQGKSVLIFPANFKPNPQELIRIRVDMILESPVSSARLVQVVGKILGHDEAVLLDRINKSTQVDNTQKPSLNSMRGSINSTDEEAIYVKGAIESSDDSSMRPEDLAVQEQRSKTLFNLKDRFMDNAAESENSSGETIDIFSDVDLKALERELVGGGIPEVEKIEVIADEGSVAPDENAELQKKAQTDLKNLESSLKSRIAKYTKMVADVKVSTESTVKRVEARRRQKDMAVDSEEQNIKELDRLRQQFTKALFKK